MVMDGVLMVVTAILPAVMFAVGPLLVHICTRRDPQPHRPQTSLTNANEPQSDSDESQSDTDEPHSDANSAHSGDSEESEAESEDCTDGHPEDVGDATDATESDDDNADDDNADGEKKEAQEAEEMPSKAFDLRRGDKVRLVVRMGYGMFGRHPPSAADGQGTGDTERKLEGTAGATLLSPDRRRPRNHAGKGRNHAGKGRLSLDPITESAEDSDAELIASGVATPKATPKVEGVAKRVWVRDPLYDCVELTPLARSFVDTPEFQSLRDLRQLGAASYVFPSANHTRFEHSIGCMHLVGEALQCLYEHQPELFPQNAAKRHRFVELVKIAGLCHDIGHMTMSHTFDSKVAPALKLPHHEERGVKIIRDMVQTYRIPLEAYEVEFITGLIMGSAAVKPAWVRGLVNNSETGLDLDKMDFLNRDSYYIGLGKPLQIKRMFLHMRVLPDPDHPSARSTPHLRPHHHRRHQIADSTNHQFADNRPNSIATEMSSTPTISTRDPTESPHGAIVVEAAPGGAQGAANDCCASGQHNDIPHLLPPSTDAPANPASNPDYLTTVANLAPNHDSAPSTADPVDGGNPVAATTNPAADTGPLTNDDLAPATGTEPANPVGNEPCDEKTLGEDSKTLSPESEAKHGEDEDVEVGPTDQGRELCEVLEIPYADEDNLRICFHRKVFTQVMDVFSTRYRLFREVYQHRAVVGFDATLSKLMCLLVPMFQRWLALPGGHRPTDSILESLPMWLPLVSSSIMPEAEQVEALELCKASGAVTGSPNRQSVHRRHTRPPRTLRPPV